MDDVSSNSFGEHVHFGNCITGDGRISSGGVLAALGVAAEDLWWSLYVVEKCDFSASHWFMSSSAIDCELGTPGMLCGGCLSGYQVLDQYRLIELI